MDRTDRFADRPTKVRSDDRARRRMRDDFDIWVLLRQGEFDLALVAQAIRATCERSGTALTDGWPIGLDHEFAADASKRAQWQAFLRKSRLDAPALTSVIRELPTALMQPLDTARGWSR